MAPPKPEATRFTAPKCPHLAALMVKELSGTVARSVVSTGATRTATIQASAITGTAIRGIQRVAGPLAGSLSDGSSQVITTVGAIARSSRMATTGRGVSTATGT